MSQQTPDSTLPRNSAERQAWGHGLATVSEDGTVLDTWYPSPRLGAAPGEEAPEALGTLAGKHPERRVRTEVVTVSIDLDQPPADASDAYLRLHLLSHRLVRPHEVNVDGIFGKLANVVWTSAGPCAVADFEEVRLRSARPGAGPGVRRRQVPPDDRLRRARPAYASPTPTACGSAPTSPRAPP